MIQNTEQLVNQLKNADPQKRFGAILELTSFHLPLFEGSDGEKKRSKAIEELKQLRASLATLPLIEILSYDSYNMNRAMAARALGDYGDPRALEPLRKCLDENDFEVLCSAISALGRLRDEISVPRILSFLDQSHDKWIRIEAIHALSNLHYLPAEINFRELLKDSDHIVRYEAMLGFLALSRHKGQKLKADLVRFLSDPYEPNRYLAQKWLEIIEEEEREGKS